MIGRVARARSGITLTEILISILILSVGLVSLATLFPLGLLRLREAQRASRSGFLVESAEADLEGRNLLNKSSFLQAGVRDRAGNTVFFSPWNNPPFTPGPYDPFIRDTPLNGGNPAAGVSRSIGPGLPIAYDPLWRYVVGLT